MLFGKEKKRSNFVMISYRIHLLRWVRHVTTYESTLMKLIQLSRLSQIQNGFAGPKALVGDACLFMQCKIFSKFTGPNTILPDMSFGPFGFWKVWGVLTSKSNYDYLQLTCKLWTSCLSHLVMLQKVLCDVELSFSLQKPDIFCKCLV